MDPRPHGRAARLAAAARRGVQGLREEPWNCRVAAGPERGLDRARTPGAARIRPGPRRRRAGLGGTGNGHRAGNRALRHGDVREGRHRPRAAEGRQARGGARGVRRRGGGPCQGAGRPGGGDVLRQPPGAVRRAGRSVREPGQGRRGVPLVRTRTPRGARRDARRRRRRRGERPQRRGTGPGAASVEGPAGARREGPPRAGTAEARCRPPGRAPGGARRETGGAGHPAHGSSTRGTPRCGTCGRRANRRAPTSPRPRSARRRRSWSRSSSPRRAHGCSRWPGTRPPAPGACRRCCRSRSRRPNSARRSSSSAKRSGGRTTAWRNWGANSTCGSSTRSSRCWRRRPGCWSCPTGSSGPCRSKRSRPRPGASWSRTWPSRTSRR